MKQLGFGITPAVHVRRGGLIGKVQAYIEAYPWVACGAMALDLGEWSSRVSTCLNKLKLEGNAQQRKGTGRSNKSLWASTSEAGQAKRDVVWAKLEPALAENMQAKTAERFSKAVRRANNRLAFDTREIGLSGLFTSERIEA
jgi:hypothetical protein